MAVPLSDYVKARAAEMTGDESRSARLFAAMAAADPADRTISRRAIAAAIQSGQAELAIKLARKLPPAQLPVDARLLLAAEELRQGKVEQAIAALERGVTSTEAELFAPLVKAWGETAKGRPDGAASLAALPATSPLAAIADEQRAAMLLTLGKADEAIPLTLKVVGGGGGRSTRLRLAYADGLARLGRSEQAKILLKGEDEALTKGRLRLQAGRTLDLAIDTPAKGFAEMLVALALDLGRDENKALPISLAQIARYANPANGEATILLALLLEGDGRSDDALAILRSIDADDLLAGEALDVEARLLTDRGNHMAALDRARAASQATGANSHDFGRLANVLGEMDRHSEAAGAYGQAIARAPSDSSLWTLRLLRAASLEQAGQWPEAKAELQAALKTDPDNALILNFLGYGKLERGEDIDSAEAMIRKASALRPDDASITDSLGWALYKRGRLPEAIETLGRAAAGDPGQWEIHEHLGDALYASGRRIEARFSWNAALINAEAAALPRIRGKMELGLTKANAAP
ncbi:MAG TPA: tetratricopeptide repeat protein [Sphingomicrobium sp.]|nr:tetratricopeptide repeat protein [Sphingomicrobium sp.]